jgi:DNA topoisomerase-3
MDRRINLNVRANDYIPKNQRNQLKYDNSNIEVVYDYKDKDKGNYSKGNNYQKADYYEYDQAYQNNYQSNYEEPYQGNYQQHNSYNKKVNTNKYETYDKNYDNNYGQDYNTQNYQNEYQYNQYDQYDYNENYTNNSNNKQNYQLQQYSDYNQNYTNNNYQTSQQMTQSSQGYSGNSYKNDASRNFKKGKKSTHSYPYNKQTQIYEQNYEHNYEQNFEQNYEPYPNKSKQSYSNNKKFYVVEKDVSNLKMVNQQDLEDDLYTESHITQSDLTGLTGDEYFEDDLNDDYPIDDYDEEGYSNNPYLEETSGRFGEMSLSDMKNDSDSQKNKLIFSNKEGFTNYVEEMIKNEKRNGPNITDNNVNILMIAEKPSIAKSISEAIGGKTNSRRLGKGGCVINFEGYFGNTRAKFTVSSVMGHVYTSDFQRQHNNWDSIDYLELYDVPVEKTEANRKTRIPGTLARLATGKDILCLWLDCDKEGENICYEVIHSCYPYMRKRHYQQIYRAKFSSLTKPDLKTAFNRMSERPNKFESLSVDARQVIDLKIGVSFTRFLTSAILPGIKGADTKFLSYGPCQTPTLWFCVNRQNEINSFKSKEYFRVFAEFEINNIKHKVGYKKKFYDKVELNNLVNKIRDANSAKVVDVLTNKNRKEPPAGLNTVQMLRVASSYLKMSPHETMQVAEKLYTMGYITYPRTETTKYASSFDFVKALNDFAGHKTFGQAVSALLKNYKKPALRGVDVGDHPPITPSRVANQSDLKGDQWRLYEFICANFFASVSDAAEYEEKVFQISINGEIFEADSMLITKEGFLTFMPWKKGNYMKDFPVLKKDATFLLIQIFTESDWTSPPDYLSESDLIKMMEENKIGTDASMPVHIQNICERGYVKVDANRRLIPTKLGKALIESLSAVDPEIVQPSVRAQIENYVDQVAKGNKGYEDVLSFAIELYKKKFLIVRQHYEKMLNSFKKYFQVDLAEMNKVYMNIRNKNEALKKQNRVRKT